MFLDEVARAANHFHSVRLRSPSLSLLFSFRFVTERYTVRANYATSERGPHDIRLCRARFVRVTGEGRGGERGGKGNSTYEISRHIIVTVKRVALLQCGLARVRIVEAICSFIAGRPLLFVFLPVPRTLFGRPLLPPLPFDYRARLRPNNRFFLLL